MKDLTHYFQFPVKEREDNKQKEDVGTTTLNGDCDETKPKKIYKRLLKANYVVEKNSPLSSSSLEIKSSPLPVRSNSRGIVRSQHVTNSKMTNYVDSTETVELDRHSTILQDSEDIAIFQRTPITTSRKRPCNETSSQKTANVEKQKEKKVSQSDNASKSLSVKSEVLNEIVIEDSPKKENHSLLFQKSKKSTPSVKPKSVDSSEDKSLKLCTKQTTKKKGLSLSLQKSVQFVNTSNHGFETDIPNKACSDKPSDKVFPGLNERTNAFHILMSSRIWQSPHGQSPDETEGQNVCTSPGRKQTTAVVAETSMKAAEIKENRKKRKKILEHMVEKRRGKKAKLNDTSSENEIEIGKRPVVRSKRIISVSESDSDDRNMTLDQDSNILKARDGDKQVCRERGKMVVEETDDESAEEKKQDEVMNQDSLTSSKLARRTSKKIDRSGSKLVHKNNRKLLVDEMKVDSAEPEQKKKLVVKLKRVSTKQVMKRSTQKFHDSGKKVHKERWKLSGKEKDSEVTKKETKTQGMVSEDRTVNCRLSVCKAKMSLRKLRKSTKEVVIRCNKSAVGSSFQQEVKTIASNSLNHQENGEFGNDSYLSERWIVEDFSEEERKQTEFNKEDKRNRSFTVNSGDSNCEMLTEAKKYLQSPDSRRETKKRNSLFSYFNKVCKDEVLPKPEKIQVKVQIHSPPVSPSLKTRRSSIPNDKQERRQGRSVQSKVLDMEDQIVVLESHIVKPAVDGSAVFVITTPKKHNEISNLKTPLSSSGWKMRVRLRELPAQTVSGGDSSDDDIFTPKKKCVGSKTTSDDQEVSKVLWSSKTRVNHMNAEQTKTQDNNANDEGAEGEADEVTIYSSHDSMSDAVVKLAPLFVRSKGAPKPKVDPAIVEARQNFLKSGVPESVKKMVDLQRSMEEQYHLAFPTVAHVQQQEDQLCIWNLPLVELPLRTTQTESLAFTLKQIEVVKLGTFSNCHSTYAICTFIKPSTPKPITCFRKLLHLLKLESPDFPIYRDFRRLRSKCIQDVEKPTENISGKYIKGKRRSGRKSRVTRSTDVQVEEKKNCSLNSHVMWTEKYKPTSVDDIVGNGHSIGQLKNWLECWKHYSDEVQHKDKRRAHKRKDSSSGDEFMDFDSSDGSHSNLPNNTAILVGPHGCGKTSAVYAIADELGFEVLEINTSSKRNGKRILSELQEATQSHQVRAGSEHASDGLGPFFKGEPAKSRKVKSRAAGDTSKPKENGDDHNSGKMSVILVEGVDVVYEGEDEGFVSAVNSLVASSKRPVILITNEPHYPHLARLMELHLVLKFSAPSSGRLSVWLQLVCLLEGVRVRRTEIEKLLDQNSGDVRQTMLQLQFWVLTGGNNFPHTAEICDNTLSENPVAPQVAAVDTADDHSNLSYISGDEADETSVIVPEHADCIEIFTEYNEKNFESCQIPFPLDLSHVWWNLASLLSIPESLYQDRIFIQLCDDVTEKETFPEVKTNSDEAECVVKVESSEMIGEGTESVSMTVSDREVKSKVGLVDERFGVVNKQNSEESLLEGVGNDNERKGNSISELLEVQQVEKNCCSQVEADCMSRLMETVSALDIMSRGGAYDREPCVRSWDQVPKDGTSFNEGAECLWWQNSVSRLLCHYLLEGSVHKCRTSLKAAQGCHVNVHPARVTYTKPTQQELRWRMTQHAADKIMLPAVPLCCRPYHHSVASDYMPMLRTVSRYEQDRLACNTKRRNRFFHYLKGLNVHTSDAMLSTLCAVFASRHKT